VDFRRRRDLVHSCVRPRKTSTLRIFFIKETSQQIYEELCDRMIPSKMKVRRKLTNIRIHSVAPLGNLQICTD
jgi:hypothetical protein